MNSTDERAATGVDVKVFLLLKVTARDWVMRVEYQKMLNEKENYEFIYYCPKAEIMEKKVAFVTYKLKESIANSKRKRGSSPENNDLTLSKGKQKI